MRIFSRRTDAGSTSRFAGLIRAFVLIAAGAVAALGASSEAAFALSAACTAVNDGTVSYNQSGTPAGLSGTYSVAADGSSAKAPRWTSSS